jgi:Ca2+-binding RTX toxin-like protein
VLPPFSPNVFTDSVDVNIGNGQALDSAGKVSLRAAVQESNALAGTDKISLGAGTFTLSRSGIGEEIAATGDLDITDDLIIEGAGANLTIINANSLDRVFHVRPGGKLTLKNVTITGGLVSGVWQVGGGVYNEGILNLIDCKLVGNTAYHGGGLATVSQSAVVTAAANVINTVFSGNSATERGAAIMVRGQSEASRGVLRLDNVTVQSNSATLTETGGGAGIYVVDWSDVEIRDSLFQNNSARVGGVIYSERLTTGALSDIKITNSQFLGNTAVSLGGAFFIQNLSQLNIDGSLFSQNKTTDTNGLGGAIVIWRDTDVINITGTQFLDNHATAVAGAIQAGNFGTLRITGSEFRRNQANRSIGSTSGGAISASQGGHLLIADSTFEANEAKFNGGTGGAIVAGDVNVEITGSTFFGNMAQRDGGALSLAQGSSPNTRRITNSTFSGNRAVTGDGGALSIAGSNLLTTTLTNVTMTGNQSGGKGGGIFNAYSASTSKPAQLQNTLVAGNTATTSQPDVSGIFESLGYNLIGNIGSTSSSNGATGFGATGDLIGGNGQPVINPLLGPLQDNGGPTFTHALLDGSPAIDAGVAVEGVLVDQSSANRQQGRAPEIGALERSVDLKLTGFRSNGLLTVFVDYEIIGITPSSVKVNFYLTSAAHRQESDTLLKSMVLTSASDLTPGVHTKQFTVGSGASNLPLPGVGAADLGENYFILAEIDSDDVTGEIDDRVSESNNTALFGGTYHAPGQAVYVHGSPGSDNLSITVGSVKVGINGQNYTYQNSDVTNVILRSHSGNDVIRQEAVTAGVIITGGRGDNEVLWDKLGSVLELNSLIQMGTSGIAVIDLTGTNWNDLRLDYSSASAVVGNTKELRILGGSGDQVRIGSGWSKMGSAAIFNQTYDRYIQDDITLLIQQQLDVMSLTLGSDGKLTVNGTNSNNVIAVSQFTPSGQTEKVQVVVDGVSHRFEAAEVSALIVNGKNGNDTVTLSTAVRIAATLNGGNGNDILTGGRGNDLLIGGPGDDTYVFGLASTAEADQVTENLNEGTDTLSFASLSTSVVVNLATTSIQPVHTNRTLKLNSAVVFENLIGGAGADTLFGNNLNNTLAGGAGDDKLIGATGNDLLLGGANNDTYVFLPTSVAEADQVTENANEGIDTLNFAYLTTSVVVNLASTSIQTVHTSRTLKLNSETVLEDIVAGSGADTLFGNSLNNTLSGNAGNDKLLGAGGNDLLYGGADNDTYMFVPTTVAEADTVSENLNQGIDTLNFGYLTTSVVVNLGSTSVQPVHTNRTLKLNSAVVFENLDGGSGADTLFGNTLNNTLTGNAGDDKLLGAAGNDSLLGGANNDTYMFVPTSVAEADTVTENANEGVDTLNFAYLTTSVVLNLGSTSIQTVHLNRTLKLNSLSTFENAVGGTGSDTLLGNAVANRLTGGLGDNILVGMEGGDILEAGSGRDILIGGLGLDILKGDAGDDIVIAGRTTSDTSLSNLNTLRTQWISGNAYATRITNLRAGVGNPVVSMKAKTNVLNDAGEDDVLFGGTGTDWFFRALDDVITDLVAGEILDLL